MSNATAESPLDLLSRAAKVAASSSSSGAPEAANRGGPDNNITPIVDDDSPLDFSMKGPVVTTDPHRPSVIRKLDPAKTPIKKRFKEASQVVVVQEDRIVNESADIDEHFKRSLGLAKYKDIFNPAQNSEPPPPPTTTMVEDGRRRQQEEDGGMSVDDHFAKALGSSKWRELQGNRKT